MVSPRAETTETAYMLSLQNIEDITKKYPNLGYYTFMYHYSPDRDKRTQTPDSIFQEMTKNDSEWYQKAENFLHDDQALALFIDMGFKEAVLKLKRTLTKNFITDDGISDLLLLYKFFEGICENKAMVREHFVKYSPHAYLYWFQQHLDYYKFNTPEAKSIEQNLKNIKIDKETSIDDIESNLLRLKTLTKNDFLPHFQNNYLLTHLGLVDEEKSSITTNNTHAFWIGDFYGITVPVGYLKSR
jgi:hypothetical protein